MATNAPPVVKGEGPETGTYDVPDLAALLKCSTRHVRRMVDAGEVPGVIRLGRLVRFHKGVVNHWIARKAGR